VALKLSLPKAVPLALAVGLLALGARGQLDRWRAPEALAAAFDGARAFCAQLKDATPADSVVFAPNAGAVGIWLPYLCAREFNYFPEPT
jgi:hypothetical protein